MSQPAILSFYPSVHRYPMDEYDNRTSAGDMPTNGQLPVSSLEDFRGKVLLEAMNESGCEFLTKKLGRMKPEDTQMIFSEIKVYVGMLMTNRFGSKVIQKLFAVCDDEQMNQLVSSVTVDERLLMAICLDSWGSQSMVKLLDCITTRKQLVDFIYGVRNIIVPLVNHPIGSSVIRQYFIVFPGAEANPMLGMIAENFLHIAFCEIGSSLLQAIIADVFSLRGQQRILAGIMIYLLDLSTHEFGSHVVQHVIGLGLPDVLIPIVYDLRGYFNLLSTDKYASNVVKKLMEATKETYAPMIINEIISSSEFSSVLQNPHGYSVIQSAMDYSTGTLRQTLNNLILQHASVPQRKKNAMPNKKRKTNHYLPIKNHLLLIKRRKGSNV